MEYSLKVGLFSPYDFAFPGGVNDHILNLHSQLVDKKFKAKIVAPASTKSPNDHADFIPMGRPVSIPSGGSVARVSLSVWMRPRIWKMMVREQFDIVHIHEPFASAVTLSALTFDKPTMKVPTKIATYHSYKGSNLYKLVSNRILQRYAKELDGQIAVSKPAKNFIEDHIPADYKVIPNGIDTDKFSKALPYHEYMDGKINILFVGRIEKRKGLRFLLSAYSDLKWKFPNIRLIIVGKGPLDVESSKIIGERNPEDVVFAGAVSEEEKLRYFATANVFCAPATGQESFGIVLLEAMASSTPVVASSIEGFSEVVCHNQDSLLFEPRNVEDLKKSLSILIQTPDLRERLVANGLHSARKYKWDNVSDKVIDYYHQSSSDNNYSKTLANVI